jgi:hypothetical protein
VSALKLVLVGLVWLGVVLAFVAGFFIVLTSAGPFPALCYLGIVGSCLFAPLSPKFRHR